MAGTIQDNKFTNKLTSCVRKSNFLLTVQETKQPEDGGHEENHVAQEGPAGSIKFPRYRNQTSHQCRHH